MTLENAFIDNLELLSFNGSNVGNTREVINASLVITDPTQRYIFMKERKFDLCYAVGQILWYLSGSNRLSDIAYYCDSWNERSDDGKTVNSAYGYKIFNKEFCGFSQYQKVIDILRKNPESRQAIINLHKPHNEDTKDELCTVYLQFLIRNNKLHMISNMRSNDALWGTTYDIFAFTFIQEMMSLQLGVELGNYYHNVGSMHIYNEDVDRVKLILQNVKYRKSQIKMPKEFIDEIPALLRAERVIRAGKFQDINVVNTPFSKNILMILKIKNKFNSLNNYSNRDLLNYLSRYDELYAEYAVLLYNFIEMKDK